METIDISYSNNGRFVFAFDSLGGYLEVVEYFNRHYKVHDNYWNVKADGEKLNPMPFHYLNEPTLSASTPIYVNIADYLSAIANEFPNKYNLSTDFFLNGMEQYATKKAELINPEIRLTLIGKRRVAKVMTPRKRATESTSVKKKRTTKKSENT